MDRREFLKKSGAVVVGGVLADLGIFDQAAGAARKTHTRPNIVVILVDEMRFPSVFPAGVHTPAEFLRRYMPNVYYLWQHGVKFEGYYSSGNACTPARASIATGLYPHQHWLLATRTPLSPSLQPDFPTYGKLLRQLGYQTPYFGKWHLSNPPNSGVEGYLENYGFQGMTIPDPVGFNGEGVEKDVSVIADSAAQWFRQKARGAAPFCITVSFVNPHDKQFFWAGSEADTYNSLFAGQQRQPFTKYTAVPSLENPPSFGFPRIPPNWESYADLPKHGKPDLQQVVRSLQEAVWGGAPDDPSVRTFSVEPSPVAPKTYGVGISPHNYWQRGLDMYTLAHQMVDQAIGDVVAAIPKPILSNTVIVFAADHGEYAGAHGMLSGKLGTAYEEAIHIPLVVTDLTHRFARHVHTPRAQLASSVDLAPMLVTLGNHGSTSWLRGELARIYRERLNLVELLRNPHAAGRDHILFSTDEIMPRVFNYLHAPFHVLAVRTANLEHVAPPPPPVAVTGAVGMANTKLVTYTDWFPRTTRPIPHSMQLEFYDYATAEGRAETRSHPHDPRARALALKLFNEYVPQQMEAPLPPSLKRAVAKARASYIGWGVQFNVLSLVKLLRDRELGTLLGMGNGPF